MPHLFVFGLASLFHVNIKFSEFDPLFGTKAYTM